MPLKLNVGVTKKVGESNYGSRGASVSFEVEVESALVREPDELREKIRYLFREAQSAVEEQLNGGGSGGGSGSNKHYDHGRHGNGSGHHERNGGERPATNSQVRAIRAIADRQRIDLAGRLREDYGIAEVDQLSLRQASELIDRLKTQPNGVGGGR